MNDVRKWEAKQPREPGVYLTRCLGTSLAVVPAQISSATLQGLQKQAIGDPDALYVRIGAVLVELKSLPDVPDDGVEFCGPLLTAEEWEAWTVAQAAGWQPEWASAPEWAQWCAKDADGTWYWYELQLHRRGGMWADRSNSQLDIANPFARDVRLLIRILVDYRPWNEMLFQRPQESNNG